MLKGLGHTKFLDLKMAFSKPEYSGRESSRCLNPLEPIVPGPFSAPLNNPRIPGLDDFNTNLCPLNQNLSTRKTSLKGHPPNIPHPPPHLPLRYPRNPKPTYPSIKQLMRTCIFSSPGSSKPLPFLPAVFNG